ncbi:site-specific integrase [Pedobacter miscanthi]|uniref:tyrosine-type recombinase/integrase n=1 Tax=Pedobacter miscanthi TaxID=2259170 RepID=UPI002931131C|nr:site-specific integrase [Pedobacter miscanthi]
MKKNNYTTPVLKKGKLIEKAEKGSSIAKDQAKQSWYFEYYFNGKQVRVRPDNLNRIKDHIQKQYKADIELAALKKDLEDGYNPFKPLEYLTKIEAENLTLSEAIIKFEEFHTKLFSKKKTISCYKSKLNAFRKYLENDILLKEITTNDLQDFVIGKINDGKYSQNSVKFAKRTFSAFFVVMKELGYITENPFLKFSKRIKSTKQVMESHLPFSDEQISSIMNWMDSNNKFGALFCRTIYFTCLRPAEIRGLRVRDFNLNRRTLTIRAGVKKVTTGEIKDDTITLLPTFITHLKSLDLENQNPNDYVFGNTKTFFSEKQIGENTPYNQLVKCLEAKKLNKLGHDLYSIKHTSNISRFKKGWSLDEIMKANRHTNIQQTLTYLKKITFETDLSKMDLETI